MVSPRGNFKFPGGLIPAEELEQQPGKTAIPVRQVKAGGKTRIPIRRLSKDEYQVQMPRRGWVSLKIDFD